MRWILVMTLVAGGCATSNEYAFSPPGPRGGPPPVWQAEPGAVAMEPPPAEMECLTPSQSISRWFRDRRGWTWGTASCGPVRDQGLDRLMAETLGSTEPRYLPDPPPAIRPVPSDSWLYPQPFSSGARPPAADTTTADSTPRQRDRLTVRRDRAAPRDHRTSVDWPPPDRLPNLQPEMPATAE